MASVRILGFAGSARTGSFNKLTLAVAAAGARAAGAEVTVIDLREFPLPIMDEDLEAREGEPANAKKLKDLMKAHDGFLIASPENNSSYSALLKNTIDWCSRRREGERPMECFAGKVVGIMSASPGALGGVRGLIALRTLLANMKCLTLPDQVSVPGAAGAFDETGRLKDAKLQAALEALGGAVARTAAKLKA